MLDPGQWVLLAGIVTTILTIVLTAYFQKQSDNRKHKQDVEREERNRKQDLEREERNRRWDLEDRQYRADEDRKEREAIAAKEAHERKEIAAQISIKQTQNAENVEHKLDAAAQLVEERLAIERKNILDALIVENAKAEVARKKLAEMIEANTEISTQAFQEANTVNRKIESLGIEHNALQRERQDDQHSVENIGDVVLDVQQKVTEIHEEVTDNK